MPTTLVFDKEHTTTVAESPDEVHSLLQTQAWVPLKQLARGEERQIFVNPRAVRFIVEGKPPRSGMATFT